MIWIRVTYLTVIRCGFESVWLATTGLPLVAELLGLLVLA